MTLTFDLDDLAARAAALVEAATRAGADAADAVVVIANSRSVTIREEKLEESESEESSELVLREFCGRRSAFVSATFADSPERIAERAVAMARAAPEDPFAGLADPAEHGKHPVDLELFDPTDVSTDELVGHARAAEHAMLGVPGVTRSGGTSASIAASGLVLVTSNGFSGAQVASRHGLSAMAVAGDGTRMERDYWYVARRHLADLPAAAEIGRIAAERAVRRLEPQRLTTRTATVVFEPRAATSLVGHLLGAINGAAIARGTSFLKSRLGERIFREGVRVSDDPLKPRGLGSRAFDGEGLAAGPLDLVSDGVLSTWLLDTASARELSLRSNGRAARGLGAPRPSSTNVTLHAGETPRDRLLQDVGTGLYVTDLIGQGVNLVTGDYSRGCAGYWIENGELAYPVSEITIAGNLRDMFARMVVADDPVEFSTTTAPTVAIEGMTIGGA